VDHSIALGVVGFLLHTLGVDDAFLPVDGPNALVAGQIVDAGFPVRVHIGAPGRERVRLAGHRRIGMLFRARGLGVDGHAASLCGQRSVSYFEGPAAARVRRPGYRSSSFPAAVRAPPQGCANTSSSKAFIAWNARAATTGWYSLRPGTLA